VKVLAEDVHLLCCDVSSPSLANVENTPVKIIPIQKLSYEFNPSNRMASSRTTTEDNLAIEETPVKEDDYAGDTSASETMAREIQRLSLRLRSSTPRKFGRPALSSIDKLFSGLLAVYNVPVLENPASRPATLHLSQVVNRVSRCHYVLRRYVREAEKYSPKPEEKRPASQPIFSKMNSLSQSHESECHRREETSSKDCFCFLEDRRRLFVDSPKPNILNSVPEQAQPPVTPRKASGVIKQLFSSPSSSLKRTLPSPNQPGSTNTDKRPRLF
jgi:hypothetical protein